MQAPGKGSCAGIYRNLVVAQRPPDARFRASFKSRSVSTLTRWISASSRKRQCSGASSDAVVLILILMLVLRAMQFIAAGIAENPKGPILGVSGLLTGIGAFEKLFL
jgi:hypothetical protein